MLDNNVFVIKEAHVKILKSSVRRFLLRSRVFSQTISVPHLGHRVKGVMTLFKGMKNSFILLRTNMNERGECRKFYTIPLTELSYDKLVVVSKSYIIDQCAVSYAHGIRWAAAAAAMAVVQRSLS